MTLHLMAAWGATKKQDGEHLTLSDLLGREPVTLLPPRELTETEQELAEMAEAEREKRVAAANLFLFKFAAQQAAARGQGPTIEG